MGGEPANEPVEIVRPNQIKSGTLGRPKIADAEHTRQQRDRNDRLAKLAVPEPCLRRGVVQHAFDTVATDEESLASMATRRRSGRPISKSARRP